MKKEKFQVEIIIRGSRKLTREQKEYISQWIQNRGRQFGHEELTRLTNKFSYRHPKIV